MSEYSRSFDELFPDRRLEADEELRQAQEVMLRLLKIHARVCEELGLTYWLDSGTLLGAVRHGGFIPWDDDVDVAMPREHFDLFCKMAPELLPYDVYLDTSNEYAKLRDRYSSRRALDPGVPDESLFIDVFPFRRFPRGRKLLARIRLLLPPYGIPSIPRGGSLAYRAYRAAVACAALVLRISGLRWLVEALCLIGDRHFWGYDLTKTWHHHFNDEWIFPLRRLRFEDGEFSAPGAYQPLLRYQYGDYLTPPAVDKRNHHGLGSVQVTSSCGAPWALEWKEKGRERSR